MSHWKYRVQLSEGERQELEQLLRAGSAPTRRLTHARILLLADLGPQGEKWSDERIAQALGVNRITVWRVRQRFVQQGKKAALEHGRPIRNKPCLLDGEQEAHLIALACSQHPQGQERWSMRLLARRMVELGYVEQISHETVRQILKKRS